MHTSDLQGAQAVLDWRKHLPVHPAAEFFPCMIDVDPEGFDALVRDIDVNGLRTPVVLFEENGKEKLLDGRNRLDALARLGRVSFDAVGHLHIERKSSDDWDLITYRYARGCDPYAFALSLNVHRRHLNAEKKRDLIAAVLKAKPELSDREIARMTKSSPTTVGKKRGESAANVQGGHKKRKEASGRTARGRKAGQPAKKSSGSPGFDAAWCARAKAIGLEVKPLTSGRFSLGDPDPDGAPGVVYHSQRDLKAAIAEAEADRKECIAPYQKATAAERELKSAEVSAEEKAAPTIGELFGSTAAHDAALYATAPLRDLAEAIDGGIVTVERVAAWVRAFPEDRERVQKVIDFVKQLERALRSAEEMAMIRESDRTLACVSAAIREDAAE
jgi:hypothetical protein